jgi:hypothetical protein
MLRDEEFQNALTFRIQIEIACSSLRVFESGSRLSFGEIGSFLDNERASMIQCQWLKCQRMLKPVDRAGIFTLAASCVECTKSERQGIYEAGLDPFCHAGEISLRVDMTEDARVDGKEIFQDDSVLLLGSEATRRNKLPSCRGPSQTAPV